MTALPAEWQDFVALTKPRVMSLPIFTAFCGILIAPGHIHPVLALSAILSIALGAGASGALNQWYETDVDSKMRRTANRPLPAGRMERRSALHFGVGLGIFSVLLLGLSTNWVAAAILALAILFYIIIYTIWLKPRTTHNIVIGGAAGAFPPLIGWAAVTGDVAPLPLALFALMFFWTPPHFWSLALFIRTDYAAAKIPMLPAVAGEVTTRQQIFCYTAIMGVAAVSPILLQLTGIVYAVSALVLTTIFAIMAFQVSVRREQCPEKMQPERRLFKFSILYMFLMFMAVVVDHWMIGT